MFRKIQFLLAPLLIISTILFAPLVYASPYGSGNYGSCPYNGNCPSTSSSSSSSSGSSSSTSTTPAASEIILNDFSEYFADGKKLDLKVNDIIYFDIDNSGTTEKHSITIKAITDTYVDVTIASTPIDARFLINDDKKFDVNNDNQDDIEIILNSITGTSANFTFKNMGKVVKTTPTAAASAAQTATAAHKFPWLLVISLSLLGLGLLWFFILWLKRRGRNQKPPPSTTFTPNSTFSG